MTKEYLFVFGAPRSGTSGLANLLNTMDNTQIGTELFRNVVKIRDASTLSPADFTPESLTQVVEKKFKPEAAAQHLGRFEKCGVVGDKDPLYHRILPQLSHEFPGCGFVFIFRNVTDVARSFQRRADDPSDTWKLAGYNAVNYWCEAAHNYLAYFGDHRDQCTTLYFNTLFSVGSIEATKRAETLRAHLAKTWEVGEFDTASLRRILNVSDNRKAQNEWGKYDQTEAIFETYFTEIARPKWTLEQYRDMHGRLLELDINHS